jgi:pyruvate dehydrogenase E2 component (dihydrolipoamide acetyltransferase)
MTGEVVMPQLGLTMTEGKVLQWYKNVGDSFQVGEPLFEVETDKVNMDVEATEAGELTEIVAPLNETLAIKTVIARYARPGQAAPEPVRKTRQPVSPRARKAALEAHVDLSRLKGTGPGGRIIERDVLAAMPAGSAAARPAASPPRPSSAPSAAPPASRLRSITAERLTQSFQSAPHFYVTREVDAGELLNLKRTLAPAMKKRGLAALSVTDMLLKAMAVAIAEHPAVNSYWMNGEIKRHTGVSVGVATAVEGGLLVPVLRNAQELTLSEIARRRTVLVDRARSGKLGPDDFGGASATLSNLGMYGVDQFQAILNPPESVIAATGRIRDRIVAVNGVPAVRPTMFVTLSADHRVVDGAGAAQFLATFAEMLETPGLLLVPEGAADAR